MKIIKHGDPQKMTKRFVCSSCGCIFEADSNEYRTHFVRNEMVAACDCPEPNCVGIGYSYETTKGEKIND